MLLAGNVGSGLLVLIHDAVAGVAGVLHAVLPDSRLDTARAAAEPALFVDSGIRALLAELDAAGAVRERCRTHVVGAAEPRYVSATGPGLTVGRRNLEAITTALRMSALEITSNHTGSGEFQGARLEVGTGVVTLLKSRCREEVL